MNLHIPKLTAKHPKISGMQEKIYLNDDYVKTLSTIQTAYLLIVGKPVSKSLIFRRALDALVIHLCEVMREGEDNAERRQAEAEALIDARDKGRGNTKRIRVSHEWT